MPVDTSGCARWFGFSEGNKPHCCPVLLTPKALLYWLGPKIQQIGTTNRDKSGDSGSHLGDGLLWRGGGGGQTKKSQHSLLTVWYSRGVQFYDDPTNDRGSGSDTW